MDSARGAAHAVTGFFQGNPMGTRIGTLIEQATDPALTSENWELNIEICDSINALEDGPRDAVRAIRKRLKDFMGKSNQGVMNTLIVLETCVKNCDRRFHHLVSQKDFVQELVKMIGPKYDPPQAVQEKVLSLIQSWADAFNGQPDLKGVCEVYEELKVKGVEFPMTDLDSMAPIYTPKKSVLPLPSPTPRQPATITTTMPAQRSIPSQGEHSVQTSTGSVHLSPEQLAKLRSELDVVSGNLQVLREMLSELHPGHEDAEDLQLLQDLYNTCRQMQNRLLELLDRVANEEVTSELLLMNDEMNNVFSKYDRFMANRQREQPHGERQAVQTKIPASMPTASPATAVADTSPPLIDFGSTSEEDGLSQQLAAMSVNGNQLNKLPQTTATSAEFDMFNQTRGSSLEQARQSGSTYYDNTTGLDQMSMGLGTVAQQRSQMYTGNAPSSTAFGQEQQGAIKESEYKEMENWLNQQGGASASSGQQNDEFDNFLSRRAEASATSPPISRQQHKKDDERLFSL